jgi:hypothetical protein
VPPVPVVPVPVEVDAGGVSWDVTLAPPPHPARYTGARIATNIKARRLIWIRIR